MNGAVDGMSSREKLAAEFGKLDLLDDIADDDLIAPNVLASF
jgi:hypothetical protein